MVSAPICKQASAVLQKRPACGSRRRYLCLSPCFANFWIVTAFQYLVISHSVAYTAQGLPRLLTYPERSWQKP